MDGLFTYSREEYEKNGIDKNEVMLLIMKHKSRAVDKLQTNYDYYTGRHAIIDRKREAGAPNARVMTNHAKDIADTASGYFMGTPITYEHSEKIDELVSKFDVAECDDTDQDNALNLSIFGITHEYVYAVENESELKTISLDPRHAFIVCDDTIEHNELFAVYYDVRVDDVKNRDEYYALVCDDKTVAEYTLYPSTNVSEKDIKDGAKVLEDYNEINDEFEHNLGYIPIIEYRNNKYCIGDFEQQIGLIDAYNTLTSDRINDKEQFIDAILVLYGGILGDTEEETEEQRKQLKRKKLLEMPLDSRAEYLARSFDEGGMETLRRALKEDIYTLSHVPNMTDANFAGNSSGVAMEYKLLGLEMLTKVKERYYRKALRKRIKIFCNYYGLKSLHADSNEIIPYFSRSLPRNIYETAQIINMLGEHVSEETLIKLLPFVESPQDEIEKKEAENEKKIAKQMELMQAQQAMTMNTPPQAEPIDEIEQTETEEIEE